MRVKRDNPVFLSEGNLDAPRDQVRTIVYDIKGRESTEAATAVAKVDVLPEASYYALRVGGDGSLIDPHSPFFRDADLVTTNHRFGRPHYAYRRVSRPVFDDYIQYLKSGNASFLRRAQKEVFGV